MSNSYNAANTQGKHDSHDLLHGMIRRHLANHVVAYTLPGWNKKFPKESFQFEKTLVQLSHWPTLYMVENDEEVYKKQCKFLEKNLAFVQSECELHYGDAIDGLKAVDKVDKLNFVWLDYCGYLTEDKWSCINYLANSGKLANKAVVSVTFLWARQHKEHNEFYTNLVKKSLGVNFYNTKKNPNGFVSFENMRKVYFDQLIAKVFETAGYQVEVKHPFFYQSSKASHMGLHAMYLTKK